MKSLSKLFRYGPGPSSSHTIAPSNAARRFKSLIKEDGITNIVVTLYGSLAFTALGHHTDKAIVNAFSPYNVEVRLDKETPVEHPLTMKFSAYKNNELILEKHYSSLGGGEITSSDDLDVIEKDIYPYRNFEEIKSFMKANSVTCLKDFALLYENEGIDQYLEETLEHMFSCIENGLKAKGRIPTNNNPRLIWDRSAGKIYEKALSIPDNEAKKEMLLTAYAYAVGESSASGEEVVTSPTCGSSGVLPAILYYEYKDEDVSKDKLVESLFVAGIFGNIVKQNASIAGAIGGCQAEIGTASSMAAAALCYIKGLDLFSQEYAAECAMEHFLGLSCDPVDGYVVIPCIERNGMGVLRSYDAYLYAKYVAPIRKNQVSFDNVVSAMKLTGDALEEAYKETAKGGLAKILKE